MVIIALVLSKGILSFAGSSTNEIDDKVIQLISNYFVEQNNILLSQNDSDIGKLADYFLNGNENEYYQYLNGKLKYIIESYKINDINRYWDKENFDFKLISSNKNIITIEISVNNEILYNYMEGIDEDNINHLMTISVKNDTPLIVKDEYNDEFSILYGQETNFDELTSTLVSNDEIESILETSSFDFEVSPMSEPGDQILTYGTTYRNAAVTYAKTYTDNTGTTSNANYNTENFKTYSDTDCQNYISQSIWAGFGGESSADKDMPMYSYWWANLSGETDTWNWTGTSYFKSHIENNYSSNDYGIQGYATSISNIQIGDYIYVPGHVMFVTKLIDSNSNGIVEYNEIYISAHTNNRLDKNLQSLYSTQPSDMKFMHIVRLKWNTAMQI